jgi:endonuclease YncB( thermonuclease family)
VGGRRLTYGRVVDWTIIATTATAATAGVAGGWGGAILTGRAQVRLFDRRAVASAVAERQRIFWGMLDADARAYLALTRSHTVNAIEWAQGLQTSMEAMWSTKNALDLVASEAVRDAADELLKVRMQISDEGGKAAESWKHRLRPTSQPMLPVYQGAAEKYGDAAKAARNQLIDAMRVELSGQGASPRDRSAR